MITKPDVNNRDSWLLDAGEKLLWSAMPVPAAGPGSGDIFMIPFSLAWAGFAFFWEYNAVKLFIKTHEKPYIFFIAFGMVFVIAGIYLVIGRFFYDAYAARRTYYAVTDRRVIIRRDYFPVRFMSIFFDRLDKIELIKRGKNIDSITFGSGSYSLNNNNGSFYNPATGMYQQTGGYAPYYRRPPGFYNIEDAETAYMLLLKQKQNKRENNRDNLS